MWKLRRGVTRVIKSLCQSPPKHTAEQHECGELFQRYHLQNCQNTDEIDSVGNNLSMELDSQAYQWNQIEVLPATIEVNFEAKSNFIITNEENKH